MVQRELARLLRWSEGAEFPPVNVYRTDEGFEVEALVPGVPAGELEVSVMGDTLTIRGKRGPAEDQPDPQQEPERYRRRERELGSFSRTVVLPEKVDPERVSARAANGLLTVWLATKESRQARKIAVTG